MLAARPMVEETEARKTLAIRSPWPPFGKARLEKAEIIFIPHYLFELIVAENGHPREIKTAVDAITGHFAIWNPEIISMYEAGAVERQVAFRLDRDAARGRLLADYRWALIAAGLKTRGKFEVVEVKPGPEIYYPFWVGYFVRGEKWRYEVMDAITGMRQGGKVRDSVLAAIMGPAAVV